jgi:hypothetical protein
VHLYRRLELPIGGQDSEKFSRLPGSVGRRL